MIRALLARLELSQTGAALMLDIGPRTMRRWCSRDERPPTAAIVALAAVAEIVEQTGEAPGEVIARLSR
jgi:DNA-binding transcriptional regulator YiaG